MSHLSWLRAALCHALPCRRQLLQPPCLSPLQALPSMLCCVAISTRSSWGRRCSTQAGGWPMGGSAVQSHASARVASSRPWSPTHSRRWHCTGPQTHSLTPPRMAKVGSCFPLCPTGQACRLFPDPQLDPMQDPPPGSPALTSRLVCGSSQLGPRRPARASGCILFCSKV